MHTLAIFVDHGIMAKPMKTLELHYPMIQVLIILNICLGAGGRQYCRYTKSPLGITPLKEIWESPNFL